MTRGKQIIEFVELRLPNVCSVYLINESCNKSVIERTGSSEQKLHKDREVLSG